MIIVKVERWPWGRKDMAQELECLYIRNTGNGNEIMGSYKAAVTKGGYPIELFDEEIPKEFEHLFAKSEAATAEFRNWRGKGFLWNLIANAINKLTRTKK